eukprot:CAMPEP_0185831100 /NCGR_PEP_ID=MMETSP1353-20130828/1285_1 /TAXON_ID=1077150 /ORGANISM="Erythrolobus australicus, Strain CCMP3124" /LENGTH=259 /DNA_ID=CAMNT_0028529123 /DNA_START=108 /DNA_END=887 /DNA_ORIENTATION=-
MSLQRDQLDFVLLPEMAFTGYVFANKGEIAPYLERSGEGATFDFCRRHALCLNTCVAAGYPEVDEQGVMFNSLCVVDKTGSLRLNYRKRFLFEADKTWATPGDIFTSICIDGFNVGVGICMDINPEDFDMERDTFALASHCAQSKVDVLLLSTAWCRAEGESTELGSELEQLDEIDETHYYWVWRLTPLLSSDCVFVAANRTGVERGYMFVGSSVIMTLQPLARVQSLSMTAQDSIIAAVPLHKKSKHAARIKAALNLQ